MLRIRSAAATSRIQPTADRESLPAHAVRHRHSEVLAWRLPETFRSVSPVCSSSENCGSLDILSNRKLEASDWSVAASVGRISRFRNELNRNRPDVCRYASKATIICSGIVAEHGTPPLTCDASTISLSRRIVDRSSRYFVQCRPYRLQVFGQFWQISLTCEQHTILTTKSAESRVPCIVA